MTDLPKPGTHLISDVDRLRRERNRFAAVALVLVTIAIAVSWPRRLQRTREHRVLNTELLDLQAQINSLQRTTIDNQRAISSLQDEIRRLQTSSP
jgi:hypothetical protein